MAVESSKPTQGSVNASSSISIEFEIGSIKARGVKFSGLNKRRITQSEPISDSTLRAKPHFAPSVVAAHLFGITKPRSQRLAGNKMMLCRGGR